MRRRARAAAALAALAVVVGTASAVLAAPPPASAHSVLIGTTPKARSTVTSPRSTVRLTFNEAVQTSFAQVVVTDSAGDRLSVGKPDIVDATVTQRIQPFRSAGGYRVAWRVVSADGHPVSGAFTFTVRASAVTTGSPTAPAGTTASPSPAPGQASGGQQSFLQRHAVHILVGLVVVVVGGGILWWERRRRSD